MWSGEVPLPDHAHSLCLDSGQKQGALCRSLTRAWTPLLRAPPLGPTSLTPSHNMNLGKKVKVSVTQSCLTLCDPMDCRPPGSSVHGILQARILEWVPFPSPGDLLKPGVKHGSPTLQADSLPTEPPGEPWRILRGNTNIHVTAETQ